MIADFLIDSDISLFLFLNGFSGESRLFDSVVVFLASHLQYFLAAAFILFLFFSVRGKKEKIRIFLTALFSVLSASLAVRVFKDFFQRPRPFWDFEVQNLLSDTLFYSGKNWSFPSGHSAFFFAMGTAVFLHNRKWGSFFLAAALLMNASRVIGGVHYPLDVLGGAAVGIAAGFLAFKILKKVY